MLEEGGTLYSEIHIDQAMKKLKAEIIEIVNDNKVIISCPMYQSKVIVLNIGERYRFEYTHPISGLFQFVGLVVNRDKIDHVVRIQLLKVSDVKKSQRREFFRLPVIEDVIIKVKTGETSEEFIDKGKVVEKIVSIFDEHKCLAKDISAGGMKLVSKVKIDIGVDIFVKFVLEGVHYELAGTVLRCFLIEDVVERYELGIQFKNIENTTQTNLIAVIFNKQRKMLKKGMI
jgi:c-di-GMP-binding flagellar brake protein YcgR